MDSKTAVSIITKERKYLDNVLKVFKDEHGDFKPTEEMYSVSQQIKHIALSTKWFYDEVFGPGANFDLEKYLVEIAKPITLKEARDLLNTSYDNAVSLIENKSTEELDSLLENHKILGTMTRSSAILLSNEHTAHHRGALTVYLRLLGLEPTMVYAE